MLTNTTTRAMIASAVILVLLTTTVVITQKVIGQSDTDTHQHGEHAASAGARPASASTSNLKSLTVQARANGQVVVCELYQRNERECRLENKTATPRRVSETKRLGGEYVPRNSEIGWYRWNAYVNAEMMMEASTGIFFTPSETVNEGREQFYWQCSDGYCGNLDVVRAFADILRCNQRGGGDNAVARCVRSALRLAS